MSLIDSVVANKMCTGCGLCTLNQMDFDLDGYARPVNGIDDVISKKCCPGRIVNNYSEHREDYNLNWGPIKNIYSGHSSDKSIRNIASSGGVITGILKYILESGQVDAVVQIGSDKEKPLLNNVYINDTLPDVIHCAGSRYSPSSPLGVVRGLLDDNKKYVVVGKPCDIAAIRALKNLDKKFDKKFPFLISFFCAGIPSIGSTRDILAKFGMNEGDLSEFRYRGDGWPGLTKAITKSGEMATMTYSESWGSILNRKLQPRCKICADGTGEAADIVCGDAWVENDGRGYPSFEERDGESLILVRTNIGKKIIEDCCLRDRLSISMFDIDKLDIIQPFQKERKEYAFYRQLALRCAGRKVTKFSGYRLFRLSLKVNVINSVRAFLGSMKRSFTGTL